MRQAWNWIALIGLALIAAGVIWVVAEASNSARQEVAARGGVSEAERLAREAAPLIALIDEFIAKHQRLPSGYDFTWLVKDNNIAPPSFGVGEWEFYAAKEIGPLEYSLLVREQKGWYYNYHFRSDAREAGWRFDG